LQWNLLPDWQIANQGIATLLLWSSILGIALGAFIYLNDKVEKPVRFGSKAIQDFFAYDFYTAKLYRVTIVFAVGLVSKIVYWIDRYLVDGVVNLVGLATMVGGQGLKYNVSGQTQFYMLSILLGLTLFGIVACWPLLLQL
jgi:NAD(P)H-quinone oxidoreductase subunit 5